MTDIITDCPAEGIYRITLNRPDALNTFTFSMYEELIEIFERLRFDRSVRVVLLTGAGKAFCAGHDVRAGSKPGWIPSDASNFQSFSGIMTKLGSLPPLVRALPQAVIAVVNGVVAGTGYSLALAADLCIAASSAKFVNAYHNAGTGHELGISYMLPRAVGVQRAAEILLTGRRVSAAEAAEMGMILRVVDDAELMDAALALADEISLNSPIDIALTKQSMWMNADASNLEAAITVENRAIFMVQSSEDTAEKRRAFAEKRRPIFTGK